MFHKHLFVLLLLVFPMFLFTQTTISERPIRNDDRVTALESDYTITGSEREGCENFGEEETSTGSLLSLQSTATDSDSNVEIDTLSASASVNKKGRKRRISILSPFFCFLVYLFIVLGLNNL